MSILPEHALTNPSTGQKRKREELERVVELDQRPFTIKADTANPFARPPSFLPLCLVPRAALPLAHLDPLPDGNRFFSAHIHSLEALADYDSEPTVLIAKDEKTERLHAIERVHRRTYALCLLRSDVKDGVLHVHSRIPTLLGEKPDRKPSTSLPDKGKAWWARAAVSMPSSATTAGKLAHDSPQLVILVDSQPKPVGNSMPGPGDKDPASLCDMGPTLTAQDHLQELTKQYLEALYISRTSLAYFAKGPLSRARAALTSSARSDTDPGILISFLREAILSASLTDKKYRESICELVKNTGVRTMQTPEDKPKAKRKRKWKPKRDKAGYFVDESDYVERWWSNEATSGGSMQGADDVVLSRASRLRSRETYLQVILALEVLALESVSPPRTAQDKTPGDDTLAAHNTKKAKVKKPLDLHALLETLVERLCIWHSLEGISPAAKKSTNDAHENASNDELRNFCIEVIIPFYMSRIAKTAAMVNKRLGGPSAAAPSKRRQAAALKPGEPAVRQAPEKKPRRSLARTSTDTFSDQASRPQLLRAATDMTAIKREATVDIVLSSIPFKPEPTDAPPRKRVSIMDSLKARQVDFSAVSQVNDAKLRKKAEMQERVKEAVDAIRKPNRDLATQETAVKVDASFAKATAPKSRVQKKRDATVQRISIEATPKYPRAVKATPSAQRRGARGLPSSGSSMVPASSMKGNTYSTLVPPSSIFAVPATGHRARDGRTSGVEETPSRGFSKFLPQSLAREPGTLAESPLATRRGLQNMQQTPVKPIRPLSLSAPNPHAEGSATPVQARSQMLAPDPAEKVSRETSVYAALGWDDDEYEELA